MTALIVVGGFAGAGKSELSVRLARDLAIPRLSSDVIGGTIRDSLQDPDAFRAGYDVLFTLADEFLSSRCSVIVDTNMGWEFQWHLVDDIVGRQPGIVFLPIILRCPRELCMERIAERHRDDQERNPAHGRPSHLDQIWALLERIDRPDIRWVDATASPDQVHIEALRHITHLID